MPRETSSFTTPLSNQIVEIKTYLIGRERRELTNVVLGRGVAVNDGQVSGITADLVEARDNLAWKLLIVSIGGKKEGDIVNGNPFSIVDAILDMRSEDYDSVIAKVNELTAPKKN